MRLGVAREARIRTGFSTTFPLVRTLVAWTACACAAVDFRRRGVLRRRLVVVLGAGADDADVHLATIDLHRLQLMQQRLRHTGRQVKGAVIVMDVDATDMLGFEPGFGGDGVDDTGRRRGMRTADLDAEGLHLEFRLAFFLALAFARFFDRPLVGTFGTFCMLGTICTVCTICAHRAIIITFRTAIALIAIPTRAPFGTQHRWTLFSYADLELLTGDPDFLEMLHQVIRHVARQIQYAVVVEDFDTADMLGVHAGFVGDGADDVARLDAMVMTDFDAISLSCVRREISLGRTRTLSTLSTLCTLCTFATLGTFIAAVIAFGALSTFRTFLALAAFGAWCSSDAAVVTADL